MNQPLDVLILGAGVSGVGMACRLTQEHPDKSFLILERRARIGGTWDLFRYPGVRSDSDMFTYGYQFKPWRDYRTLADGTSIRNYLGDTAGTFGIHDRIEYGLHCTAADWDSKTQLWTVTATDEASGETRHYQARFVVSAQGYYNYDHGYRPHFEGEENFKGQIIHPQQWPEELDYSGKKVVVIGSGATAVTLVPSMADKAAKVTMLQRSPTYIFSLPGWDKMTELLDRVLPDGWSFSIARKRNEELWQATYKLCRRFPKVMRQVFEGQARYLLGKHYSAKDFSPKYGPWEQRLCAVPDANLYTAIKGGKAEVVTDHIDHFTPTGIALKSGKHLDADIIITATGLSLQTLGGMAVSVDGAAYNAGEKMLYKSVLMQDLPNFAWILGYINLSWTMKADMTSLYICRLLKYMDDRGLAAVTPRDTRNQQLPESILDMLNAGYVQRAKAILPRQGKAYPWFVRHNYQEDKKMMLHTAIDDPQHLETVAAGSRVTPIRRAA
ncbi:NAD(P)/FAD-dependent oxidoreductase [Sinimarinibacterium sp. NLF-5-8]|uniref:flavin-containing monooxygenase n=1 Tax=Sinimarinibacterium sp. NLF-5-8 TaxID=2698684 RepID=UPI00137BFC33|nr:NAD(P)/FAD-dependent oxidoreductase [Sinimarinibacterium sp. NLF-5-8]QHS08814.1 NAD(P)/FAD-dependent oxidoreductase [Sinimarinibacterium sp. NLF-5-8]